MLNRYYYSYYVKLSTSLSVHASAVKSWLHVVHQGLSFSALDQCKSSVVWAFLQRLCWTRMCNYRVFSSQRNPPPYKNVVVFKLMVTCWRVLYCWRFWEACNLHLQVFRGINSCWSISFTWSKKVSGDSGSNPVKWLLLACYYYRWTHSFRT
jgi:hypothetical protein